MNDTASPTFSAFNQKHLLGLADYSAEEILRYVLDQAKTLQGGTGPALCPKVPTLRDKTIVNLFYESSTRTRLSFELAQKRMGADVVELFGRNIQHKKGGVAERYHPEHQLDEDRHGGIAA